LKFCQLLIRFCKPNCDWIIRRNDGPTSS